MNKDILDVILTTEERTPHWLSKKLGCSHTLVYKWLSGKIKISEEYQIKINKVFGRGGSYLENWNAKNLSEM